MAETESATERIVGKSAPSSLQLRTGRFTVVLLAGLAGLAGLAEHTDLPQNYKLFNKRLI